MAFDNKLSLANAGLQSTTTTKQDQNGIKDECGGREREEKRREKARKMGRRKEYTTSNGKKVAASLIEAGMGCWARDTPVVLFVLLLTCLHEE